MSYTKDKTLHDVTYRKLYLFELIKISYLWTLTLITPFTLRKFLPIYGDLTRKIFRKD